MSDTAKQTLIDRLLVLAKDMRATADAVELRARSLDTQDGWRQSHRWFRKADELREGARNAEDWEREIRREDWTLSEENEENEESKR